MENVLVMVMYNELHPIDGKPNIWWMKNMQLVQRNSSICGREDPGMDEMI
jgi:hypothetical protein